jgi:hypothetical protein
MVDGRGASSKFGLQLILALIAILTLQSCRTRVAGEIESGTGPFLFGIAKNKKCGFIDGHGKVVVEPQFDRAGEFSEGLAAVCIGLCEYAATDESTTSPTEKERIYRGKWGFIDTQGKMVINPRFSMAEEFHKGLAPATVEQLAIVGFKPNQRKFGYIDKNGNFVIPQQFQSAEKFDEFGLAIACVGDGESSRCGFINTSGKFVITPQFWRVQEFKNGLAMVFEGENVTASFIDRSGHVVWKGGEPVADWFESLKK